MTQPEDKNAVLAKTFLKGSLLILLRATMKTSVMKVIIILQTPWSVMDSIIFTRSIPLNDWGFFFFFNLTNPPTQDTLLQRISCNSLGTYNRRKFIEFKFLKIYNVTQLHFFRFLILAKSSLLKFLIFFLILSNIFKSSLPQFRSQF